MRHGSRLAAALGRALVGVIAGAALGVTLIGVGALRFCAAGGTGGQATAQLTQDTRLLTFYVGGFALAGALAGAAEPFLPGRSGTFARFGLGGALVMLAVGVGDKGSLGGLRPAEWVIFPIVGVLFGFAFARGVTRNRGEG